MDLSGTEVGGLLSWLKDTQSGTTSLKVDENPASFSSTVKLIHESFVSLSRTSGQCV